MPKSKFQDTFKHKGDRSRLVETIRSKGISNDRVLKAIGEIPRHWFLDSALDTHAYDDRALPIDDQQTISQPFTVAYQTELLNPQSDDKILEIGTGSGFQAAVLAKLCNNVFSIERIESLSKKAQKMLDMLQLQATLKVGDGTKGWAENAPYDKIIVTAGAPTITKSLVNQLALGGKLVIPVGDKVQTMYLISRDKDGKLSKRKFSKFKFVPLIGEEGYNESLSS